MKTVRWFAPALAGIAFVLGSPLRAAVLEEDFTADPLARGWQAFGNTNLFVWNAAAGNLEVTWDSREPNSYFCRPLGTVLNKSDNFSVAFDLRLSEITPGIDPAKANAPFQIAVGLIRMADATSPDFRRGSGWQSPNIVEFDFFPDPGGEWQWGPSVVASLCDRTGFNWSSGGFAPVGLTVNDLFRIIMTYDAASLAMRVAIERNGEAFATVPAATLGANFTDFLVDAVAVCSYSDAGQWPGFEGSILARGAVDNVAVTLPPPPVARATGAIVNNAWQVQFTCRSNWLYTLERTVDLQAWTDVSPTVSGNGTTLILEDANPPAARAFYRVRAQRP